MMYSHILTIIFFALVLYKTTDAAVAVYPPEEKPAEFADQKGCYLSSLDLFLQIGVPYSPRDGVSCQQYTCNENGFTQLFTCGSLGVGKGCVRIEGDRTLPYPDCCDSMRCAQEDETFTESDKSCDD